MALVPHTSPMARVPQARKLSRPTAVAAAAELRVQVEVAVAAAVLRVLHALRQPKTPPAATLLMEGLGQVALQVLTQLLLRLLVVAAVEEEAAVAGAAALLLLLLRMLRAAPQVQPRAALPLLLP